MLFEKMANFFKCLCVAFPPTHQKKIIRQWFLKMLNGIQYCRYMFKWAHSYMWEFFSMLLFWGNKTTKQTRMICKFWFILYFLEKNDEAHLSQLLLITFNVANFQLLGTKAQAFPLIIAESFPKVLSVKLEFLHSVTRPVPSAHSYVQTNFTQKNRDFRSFWAVETVSREKV